MRFAIDLKPYFLILPFLWLASTSLYAQQRSSSPELISGRVVAEKDSTAGIAFVQVYNKSTGKGTTTNPDGHFKIMALLSDSIQFRMIGYVDTTLSISQLRNIKYQLPLKERVYTLKQLNVRASRFKQPFAPAEPSKDPYVGYRSVKPSGRSRQEDKISVGPAEGGFAVSGAITALANKFNKKEKQREKVRALKAKENEEKYYKALFEYWFDPEIVTDLTGLTGSELKRFLNFCKPSLAFLEEANEYQVILAIQRYHRQYQNVNRY